MVSCERDPVGCRVAVGDHRGTIRYIGPLPGVKGTWLGIEWDDHFRGKHDGTHNGVRYFQTRHPTSGSFIHIEKADFGRSCVSAITERYASNQLTLTVEELQEIQKAINAPSIEMVGFDKVNQQQRCFENLRVICLSNQQVNCAGDGLGSLCPNIEDIDLSSNLFISWEQVAEITVNFPHLQFINLSDNSLKIPENPENLQNAFKNISHVVLGHMGYTWDQICTCSKMWPNIENLQVPFNNITNITLPEQMFVNLTSLDLEGNSLSQWEEINKLGVLSKLETLNLCNLGLINIYLPESQNLFQSLKCLMLSDNKIDKWEYISHLDRLPRLHELRFSKNPILDNISGETALYKIVARIGSLKVFNRTLITREDRRGAEMDYIKENGLEWVEASKNEQSRLEFLSKHPRYQSLIKKHGGFEESELEVKSRSLKSNLVKIKLCSEDKTITKTVPKAMSLSHLIALAQRLFHTGTSNPELSYQSSKNPGLEVKMDDGLKSLDFYSIEDGDEIRIAAHKNYHLPIF